MKKLSLALAITAFSGFASATDDLVFDDMGTLQAAEDCYVAQDMQMSECYSADFNLEEQAYNETLLTGSTSRTDANSLQGQARGLAQIAVANAVQQTVTALGEYDLASGQAQSANDEILSKQGLENTARDEYITALSDSQAAPTDTALQQTAVDKAQAYLDAVGVRELAESDGAVVLQAQADALQAYNSAQDAESAANDDLAVESAKSANSFTWTNALQGAVDEAQNYLDDSTSNASAKEIVLAEKRQALAAAESAQIVADQLEVTTLQAKTDADNALTSAISAYEDLDPNVDAPEDIQAAATLITTKSTESANAATAYDDALSGVTAASAAVTTAGSQVSAAELSYDVAVQQIGFEQSNLAMAQADQAVHSAYLENEENPASALMDQLIDGNGADAQAVVVAVSDLYEVTEDNADDVDANTLAIEGNDTDIAANATAIAGNDTDIAANATAIAGNDTDIAANVATLEVHEGLVTQNITDISANAAGIADNVATLAVHEGLVTQNITDISTNAAGIADNVATLAVHEGLVTQNIADISANQSAILNNQNGINANSASITQLDRDLDVVRSGVAAALAASSIPMAPGQGWGAGIGTGYFDGESAIAAGLSYRAKSYNFKFSVGNSGGETSASAGAAWNF